MAEPQERPWDAFFKNWIAIGQKGGEDPNDAGDREWGDPRFHVEQYYNPHIQLESTVLEIGPGSGRITRHVIGRCREMILVDYSQFACNWLDQYLAGKGQFRTICIDQPSLAGVPDGKVNFLFAFGVFEHIDLDDLRWFLEEFYRVLVPGGVASFNFDNLMTRQGLDWHKRWRQKPGHQHIFRFYHPEMIAWLARDAGFTVSALRTDDSRLADIDLRK